MEILRFKADTKQIAFLEDLRLNPQQEVKIDGNRLKQIIINLLSNAIKYT